MRLAHELLRFAEPVMGRLVHPDRLPWFGRVPAVPASAVPRLRSPARPWTAVVPAPPEELRTQPGIARVAEAEDEAAHDRPLHQFFALHADAVAAVAGHLWPALVSVAPRLIRSTR